MAEISNIEWTDATWNPIRGCTKISPGCAHCYAETFAERFRGVPGHPYQQGFDLRLVPEHLLDPFRWSKPKMVFVNSMSDLFHEAVPTSYIQAVARVMVDSPWNVYQVLTKRAERLHRLLTAELRWASDREHIWWGVSVENRTCGLPRIPHLTNSAAKIRFLSIEPLLEDLGEVDMSGIDWIIVGGESGRGARPMKEEWVLSLLRQSRKLHIPFFFKQWGGMHKSRAGRHFRGHLYDEFPAIRRADFPDRSARERIALELGSRISWFPSACRPDSQQGSLHFIRTVGM